MCVITGPYRTCATPWPHGNTLDYVYAIEEDTLWTWAGERGSPGFFRGTFGDGDRVVTGEWEYPGGGGYASTMTRRG